MRIASTEYSLATKSLDVYLSGCTGHCLDCHNPELHNFSIGDHFTPGWIELIRRDLETFPLMVERFFVMGGEPLDQPLVELQDFLVQLSGLGIEVWLFTSRDFEEVPNCTKDLCDYIKCGKYLSNVKGYTYEPLNMKVASGNQKIYKRGLDY